MNSDLKTDATVQFALPGGEIFHLVLGKILQSDNEFAHIQLATGSYDAINEFTSIKFPIAHPNYKTDVEDADVKIPLRYIMKEIDMSDDKIPFYDVLESPIGFTACFFAPKKMFGTVIDIDLKAGGYWVGRHGTETCSLNQIKKGLIPEAHPRHHVVFIPFGKNKIQVANLKDFNKKDPKQYETMYLKGLEQLIAPLAKFERRFVSAIKENDDNWFGFTSENEYFDGEGKLELATDKFDSFLKISYYDSGYEDEIIPQPKDKVLYVRMLHKGFAGKRSKVEWFDPADYPGIDKFLTFIRTKGDHEIFKDRDPKQIVTSMKNKGDNTIFADFVAGYFFKSAISHACTYFKEKFMWMF